MKIGIVGLGLIGGSLGRAAVKKTDHVVYATDVNESALLKGQLLNAYHEELTEKTAKELDMLFLCTYPDGIGEALEKYLPLLKNGAVVMDCVGIKRPVCELFEKYSVEYPEIAFVGGHPMAGREFSGVEYSQSNLFEKCTCLVVPVHTPIDALMRVKEFFLAIGADGLVVTTAEEHDRIIAYTSQLAHVVSAAYVLSPTATTHYGFSAGSFRDMTRVARLNPMMWTELMTKNADYLADEVLSLAQRLEEIGKALKNRDEKALSERLAQANETKINIEKHRVKNRKSVMYKDE